MELNLTNSELQYLVKILDKELEQIGKEIHRTDALSFKHELTEQERILNNILNKLKLISA